MALMTNSKQMPGHESPARVDRPDSVTRGSNWLNQYDRIFEDFITDCETLGEANAIEIARQRMKQLGFTNSKINTKLAEALS